MAYLLLGVAQAAGLLLLPFWSLGLWLQLGSLALFGWWSGFDPIGGVPLLILLALAVTAEIVEPPLAGGRIEPGTRRWGGTGGLAGAGIGAVAGVVLPLLGTLFGALLGASLGAGVGVFKHPAPGRGCAGSAGQAMALALRSTAAVAIAAFALYSIRAY